MEPELYILCDAFGPQKERKEVSADLAEHDLRRNIETLRKLRGKEHTRAIIEAEMDA